MRRSGLRTHGGFGREERNHLWDKQVNAPSQLLRWCRIRLPSSRWNVLPAYRKLYSDELAKSLCLVRVTATYTRLICNDKYHGTKHLFIDMPWGSVVQCRSGGPASSTSTGE